MKDLACSLLAISCRFKNWFTYSCTNIFFKSSFFVLFQKMLDNIKHSIVLLQIAKVSMKCALDIITSSYPNFNSNFGNPAYLILLGISRKDNFHFKWHLMYPLINIIILLLYRFVLNSTKKTILLGEITAAIFFIFLCSEFICLSPCFIMYPYIFLHFIYVWVIWLKWSDL